MTFSRRSVTRALQAHAPPGFAPNFGETEWRALENDGLDIGAYVVAADIRESTELMKEAVDPTGFARALNEFAVAARAGAWETNGWFDKFTGDGFIAYWPGVLGIAAETRAKWALEFSRRTLARFPDVMERFRRNSQNLPVGAGLSLGLDSGNCRLAMIGDDLTIIGTPIVGAVRMVSAAGPGELLANVHPGEAFARGFVSDFRIRVERSTVNTKDYPAGQEAYRVMFPSVSRSLRRRK